MGASASVIQEYYKAVDYWADIVGNKDWKLSVWIVGQNDVDLVDRFLEIERSPVGQFDDIFFRFDTPYRGDDEEYTEQLWQEYAGWFSEKVEEKYDILRALRHDGLLKEEYIPDVSVEHTAGNLWREMFSRHVSPGWMMPFSVCTFLRNRKGGIPGQDGSAMC